MPRSSTFTGIAFAASALAALAVAAAHEEGSPAPSTSTGKNVEIIERMSPELQALLREEMALIESGMWTLSSAISAGDWEKTKETAEKVQLSFILRKKMTPELGTELRAALTPEFVEMDQRFHRTAGKLAEAARTRDAELATFYYKRLLDGCTSCHSAFAAKRFPGHAPRSAPPHRPAGR
jgi:cytochrome c556